MRIDALPWHAAAFEQLIGRKARLPHALLLHGRQGVGKTTFARALAQALLCERPAGSGVACGECPACGWLEGSNHPDFRLLEPAADRSEEEEGSERKASLQIVIEQIRQIADFVNLSSHRGGAKVILIRPAEMLNPSAANALLKTLEEPPAGVYFFLVAHRIHYLLATVRSRCEHIALPTPAREAAIAWLRTREIADPELALAHTGNSPLLAEQLQGDYWTERSDFLDRLAARHFDPLRAAEQSSNHSIPDVLGWLQKWTFDLVLQRLLGRVRYNPDRAAPIAALAARIEPRSAVRLHREMIRLQRIVDHPLNPRLFLERLMFDYAELFAHDAADRHAS